MWSNGRIVIIARIVSVKDRCKRLTVKIADFMFRHGMATLIRVCERGVSCTLRAAASAEKVNF